MWLRRWANQHPPAGRLYPMRTRYCGEAEFFTLGSPCSAPSLHKKGSLPA